jgi:hypothetical protein
VSLSGPARLVVLPKNRSFGANQPELSRINHGISAKIDPKTTPYHAIMNRILKFLLFIFSNLTCSLQIFDKGQDSANLVQTAATFGGLYQPIPNDEGEDEARSKRLSEMRNLR